MSTPDSRPTGESAQSNAGGSGPDSELGRNGGVVGDVRDYSERDEGGRQVWSFVLAGHDAAGNPLPPVAVEMRGYQLEGVVRDGDNVEVIGNRHDGILRASRILNHSTNSEAGVRKTTLATKIFLLCFFGLLFLIVLLIILYQFVSGGKNMGDSLVWIAWIVAGLIAGWAAGVKGGGYGTIADIFIGIVGGVFGGWLARAIVFRGILTVIAAIIGAVTLIAISRLIKREVQALSVRRRS